MESPYGTLAERGDSDPALENAARREVETFLLLARMDCDRYVGELSNLLPPVYAPVLAGLPACFVVLIVGVLLETRGQTREYLLQYKAD